MQLSIPAFAEGGKTESELLLSGLKLAASVDDLPSEISVPSAWANRMSELDTLTRVSKTEHGACLNALAETRTADRHQFTNDYAALLARRTTMTSNDFDVEEKRLRALISDIAKMRDSGIVWNGGLTQGGGAAAASIERDGLKCEGETVADVHTHPSNTALPSDGDVQHVVLNSDLKAMFVVHAGELCAVVKTKATNTFFRPWDAKAFYAAAVTDFFLDRSEIQEDGVASVSPAVVALGLKGMSMALYCGQMGSPLSRIVPSDFHEGTEEGFALYSKGVALIMRYRGLGPPITFEFAPELDEIFLAYLKKAEWLDDEDKEVLATTKEPRDFYHNLIKAIGGRTTFMSISNFTAPDARIEKETDFYSVSCASGLNCTVTQSRGTAINSEPVRLLASFSKITGRRAVVDREGGKWRYRYRTPGKVTFDGYCEFGPALGCTPQGKGTLQQGSQIFKGQFADGKARGEGTLTSIDTGQVWRVRATADGLTKEKRIR